MERKEAREITLLEKLFEDRIIFLGEVTGGSALDLSMRLLYLESIDPKGDIFMYINSPGGSVSAGLSIFDTMNFIECDIWTICMGTAASMGAFLLAGGTKGKRICLPNSKVMIHQPLQQFGVSTFQATELQIVAKEISRTRERLNTILSDNTGQPFDRIDRDTERDYWMDAGESLDYGVVDGIAKSRKDISLLIKQFKMRREENE